MLAGRLPWSGDLSEFVLLEAKRDGKIVPPTEFYPDIPPGIVAAVMQCLRPDKADRPADIAALKVLLDRKREPLPMVNSPPGPTAPAPIVPRTGVERVAYSRGKATATVIGKESSVAKKAAAIRSTPSTDRVLFEGLAYVCLGANVPGILRFSASRLSFTPSKFAQLFGVQHHIIDMKQVVRVHLTGERQLIMVEGSGRKSRFTDLKSGRLTVHIYNYLLEHRRNLCAADGEKETSNVWIQVAGHFAVVVVLVAIFALVLLYAAS